MKYSTIIIALFFVLSCAPKPTSTKNEILINSTSAVNVGNDYEIKILKIISDSRCPEGVNCVWAGEVQLELEIYKNQKIEKTKIISINYKSLELNKQFFADYFSSDKKIKDILISPQKKQGENIELKNYILKVQLE